MTEQNHNEAIFVSLRPRLMALAYRMLGSVADSEDIVQEAWLRFAKAKDEVEYPKAYFTKIVMRLCLDQLKSARKKREQYIGTWLPEPVDARQEISTLAVENGIDISYAIMLTLEQLSPFERAAYLLHDLFDLSFDEIAITLERSPSACRKLASRARGQLAKREKRFAPTEATFEKLITAFLTASQTGDLSDLQAQLADDVKYYADGGGKITAALNIVSGAQAVAKMLIGFAKKEKFDAATSLRLAIINGQAALMLTNADSSLQPICIDVNEDGAIADIYTVRNPDKLKLLN